MTEITVTKDQAIAWIVVHSTAEEMARFRAAGAGLQKIVSDCYEQIVTIRPKALTDAPSWDGHRHHTAAATQAAVGAELKAAIIQSLSA